MTRDATGQYIAKCKSEEDFSAVRSTITSGLQCVEDAVSVRSSSSAASRSVEKLMREDPSTLMYRDADSKTA